MIYPYFVQDVNLVVAMVPLGTVLALIPNFSGTDIPMADWAERLESAAQLFQVYTTHLLNLAINYL